ncbi:MAG: hypothetical protein A3C06_00910 [Candidatus Taylorbacteria bacterium RIFCSPHIGHO2_02_FULL_46_13]|uniref:Phosphoenolpyruvate synthase n=2 Tax=Parcubacteria group TaxID=1794811 RepID=A0A1G2HXJ5_9BACT|nr:MAG: hypothetical protein A2822_01350 [Candidatus Staskawiczbacteria bacterium RIFCSPHIGHO2_01_FULL_41_41]OHA27263.1 MAG: hypothetical protein A3C06_00910 [Candidatus Taylorbacteria bacterium RIFCSPHIGHO2_02_FULL_46_13]
MKFTKNFTELRKDDAAIAGGKGASLGEMTQAGIPVPPGFVVLSSAFEQFLKETDLNVEIDTVLHSVNHQEIHTVEHASEKIQALILKAKMPEDIGQEIQAEFKKLGAEFVAVRSSATAEDSSAAAWAGQLDSFLNTIEKDLLEKVQHCWASLFTPRAIFYRFEKGLHTQKISVAVVIQKMVESETAGIAFSVHPVTEDRNQLIIEGALGLGEAVVSGQITPDSYVVEKNPFRIIDKNVVTQERGLFRLGSHSKQKHPYKLEFVRMSGGDKAQSGNEWADIPPAEGEKQVLSDEQILELSELILKIEKHYGFPCDIEWARAGRKFYIVQSRPITTLSKLPTTSEAKQKLVFEKSITRDWGMIYAEIWHKVFTEEFKKQLGWGYTEVVFEGKDNTISVYRAPAEHIDGMRGFILSCLSEKPNWLKEHARIVVEQVKAVFDLLEILRGKEYSTYSPKELANIFQEFIIRNVKLGPAFIMMLWFPIQMEDYPLAEKYGNDVQLAKDTRAQIEKIGPLVDVFGREIASEVLRRSQLPEKLTRFVMIEEILEYLKAQKKLDAKKIEARSNYFLVTRKGIIHKDIDDYLKNSGFELKKQDLKKASEIKGKAAYKGHAIGVVRIIRSKEGFGNFNEGEILVTTMTTPDFLPVLEKASAFVTDEGGVTSHAAIIAREMGKPCIIGTKIATQVLKNGDLVEVDADKGVVRILNK